MGLYLFEQDWKNVLALVTLIALVVGYFVKGRKWIKTWWNNMTAKAIQASFDSLHQTIDRHHEKVFGKLESMSGRLMGVEKAIAFNTADITALMGDRVMSFKTDEDGGWQQVSPAVKDLMGKPYGEIKDFNFINSLEPMQRKGFLERYRAAIANRMHIDEIVVLNGKRYRMKAHRIEYNGSGYIGYAGTINEINQITQL